MNGNLQSCQPGQTTAHPKLSRTHMHTNCVYCTLAQIDRSQKSQITAQPQPRTTATTTRTISDIHSRTTLSTRIHRTLHWTQQHLIFFRSDIFWKFTLSIRFHCPDLQFVSLWTLSECADLTLQLRLVLVIVLMLPVTDTE
jgi:hypothetical protein